MANPTVSKPTSVCKKRTRRKYVPATCEIEGCDGKYLAKGMCAKHYWRLYAGKDPLKRTRFDPNEIVIKGNIAEIVLYDKDGNERNRAIVDVADVPKVTGVKWCLLGDLNYVVSSGGSLLLHRLLLDAPDSMEVDHKNRNTLDNRRANLRLATHADNRHNLCSRRGGSQFKGVCYFKPAKKWRAQIASKHLGYFRSEETAALAYDKAAREQFGEFARTNFA